MCIARYTSGHVSLYCHGYVADNAGQRRPRSGINKPNHQRATDGNSLRASITFYLGVSGMPVPWDLIVMSVVIFIVVPVSLGVISRKLLIGRKGKEWFDSTYLELVRKYPASRCCSL